MKTVNLIFLAALCVVCAVAETKFGFDVTDIGARIVGGHDAHTGQFPYQISLRSKFSGQHFCGGSILSSRFLITAAHCTQGDNANAFSVFAVVGALRRLQGGVRVQLDKITPHEKYDNIRFRNDISLLRTVEEIVFTDNIQPIALPTQNLPVEGNAPVVLSGWGRVSFPTPIGQSPLPDILQFTEPNTLSTAECKQRFKGHPGFNNVHDQMVCAVNAKDVGACMGDSGGPLVDASDPDNKFLVGVVSWGVPCGRGYPDAFTRVYAYLEWIGNVTAQQSENFE